MRILIFLLIVISVALSQLPVIPIDLDYACFKGTDGQVYTEIYISFYRKDLHFQYYNDSTNTGEFTKEIKIYKNDSLIATQHRSYQTFLTPKQTDEPDYSTFVDVFGFKMDPGSYILSATVMDNTSLKKGEFQMDIEIPAFEEDLNLSQIELATKIERADEPSSYSSKNNIAIYPNASKTFTLLNPVLNFYFEAYNLSLSNTGQNSYIYRYAITDTADQILRTDTSRVKSTAAPIIAEAMGINIVTLPSNIYFLTIELTDLINNHKAIARKRFNLYKPEKTKEEVATSGYVEENIYLNFTKEELQHEFKIAKYIAAEQENRLYESIKDDAESMRRFLSSFWKKRDSDPNTAENKFRETYLERYKYVETHHSTPFRDGWKTDKGRITLIYGKPDEIERFQNTIDTQPYEIWHYYALEGGVYFIFADMDGMGDIQLLHSTARREIKDSNWKMKITKVGAESPFDDTGQFGY
jgi:GWxTD domain-containing protein